MQTSPESLDLLRGEIDRIDDALADLLVERMRVVSRIADVKNDRSAHRLALRPGREGAIMRRLCDRVGNGFPRAVLVRVWREVLAAATRAQTDLKVAAHAPAQQPWMRDLARDHLGSLTPLVSADGPQHGLRMLAQGEVNLLVLPVPSSHDHWWDMLAENDKSSISVIGRLPFARIGDYPADAEAFLLANLRADASGEDATLIVVRTDGEVSRGRVATLLTDAELDPRWLVGRREEHRMSLHLIEVAGYLQDGDAALSAALSPLKAHLHGVRALGSYPRPWRA